MKKAFEWMLGLLALLLISGVNGAQAQGVIYVTTLEDKISDTGGCSLKEAIFSANFDDNIAITKYTGVPGNYQPQYVTTQCAKGSGDDTIILPSGATLLMGQIVDDAANPTGPAVTPMITSRITIQARGATLQFDPSKANSNCQDGPYSNYVRCHSIRLFAIASSGSLTLNDANVKGFIVQGGSGAPGGGGGGMGAGGAIFVRAGALEIANSTFTGNGVIGGNGGGQDANGGGNSDDPGAGGGGLSGWGTSGSCHFTEIQGNGGGAGGARGNGIDSCLSAGGGTVEDAIHPQVPGFDCGGVGGNDNNINGQDAPCPGGGGGGGYQTATGSGNGGKGNYGGGGGGGAHGGGNGGDGGFGGGGGAGWTGVFGGTRGGKGGFGGGGGSAEDGTIGGGNPGSGGYFGGNANKFYGGGGAALGGVIFNDGGTVRVGNSTFTQNFATRGNGGTASDGTGGAANGADAGAAIFAHNGSTTLTHVTISGNETTGGGGGVYIFQDPDLPLVTALHIYNSIISGNGVGFAGPNECVANGNINLDGSGNLIVDNGSCPGVVSGANPNLGPLQNNGGLTPTMAIAKTSAAFNAADPAHAANRDQRNIFRPQAGGYDIGAFEVCVVTNPILAACDPGNVLDPPPSVILTMIASPLSGGTTTPTPGLHAYPLPSVVNVLATPVPGNNFLGWTGDVSDPTAANTFVILDNSKTVTANFTALTTTMSGNITAKSGPANARVWTLALTNNGPAGAVDSKITSLGFVQTGGTACTPHITSALPLSVGTLLAGQTGSANATIDFSSCVAAARFTATFTFSANSGTVTGSVVRTNQFQ